MTKNNLKTYNVQLPNINKYPRDLMKRYPKITRTEMWQDFLNKWLKNKYEIYGINADKDSKHFATNLFEMTIIPIGFEIQILNLQPKSDNYYPTFKVGTFVCKSSIEYRFTIFLKKGYK